MYLARQRSGVRTAARHRRARNAHRDCDGEHAVRRARCRDIHRRWKRALQPHRVQRGDLPMEVLGSSYGWMHHPRNRQRRFRQCQQPSVLLEFGSHQSLHWEQSCQLFQRPLLRPLYEERRTWDIRRQSVRAVDKTRPCSGQHLPRSLAFRNVLRVKQLPSTASHHHRRQRANSTIPCSRSHMRQWVHV